MHAIDRRIGLLFGAFVVLLAVASLRAVQLGVLHSGSLTRFANAQEIDNKVIPAVRGMITDRTGQVLALSESDDEVVANPTLIALRSESPARLAARLAPLLRMSQPKVLAGLTKANTGYSILAYDLPSSNATKIMAMNINGISDTPEEKRVEPLGTTAAQVVGWVNATGTGVAGVEDTLNQKLKGRSGITRIVEDGNQQAIAVDDTKPMKDGDRIALTLSVPLQQEVEKVLAETAATYDPKSETAIVTTPSGQLLADANWPAVNADDIGATPPANTEDESVDLSYEPGSTFKAITVAAGLMDGTITPDTEINEPPCLEVYGTCISDAEDHGYVTYSVSKILAISSNIGADLIAQRDGPEHGAIRLNYWMHRFGFGTPTGVALNGESAGRILPLSQYSGTTMYNEPFGQGEAVTPMQMVQFYDAIANGGILRTPQLIYSVNGTRTLEPAGTRVMTPEVASELRVMMRGVLADGGTASGASIPGYDLAGKTGTAQEVVNGKYSNDLFTASFIGMVPASDPKLVVSVIVSGVNNYGGTVAGPAFQKIIGWAVPHFGINPCPEECSTSDDGDPAASTP
jgi:cell division protein FtsI (penicillin-binding protein 3)